MTNPAIIKPTVGRRVWFRPSAAFLASNPTLTQFNPEQPMDAGIVYVHHDHMVNLIVTDHVGKTFPVPSVPLLAGQYEPAEDGDVYCCCEWMPYQKGQAAKAATVSLPVVDPGPDSLEREIQAKANNGPRVTPAALQAEIVSEHYFTAFDGVAGAAYNEASPDGVLRPFSFTAQGALGLLTFCVLVLRNGAKVVGVNYGAIDPAQHSAERGRQEARSQAEDKVYELLGFRLRDELARPVLTDADAAADLAGTPRPDHPTAEAADFLASVKACNLVGEAPCEACQ